ncbi:MAG: ZIP family metal transporter [Desulfarculaceae bacterium]|jgi:zinc transporter 1/2/3
MDYIEHKLIYIAAIFLVGLAGGWSAQRLEGARRAEFFFSLGSSLAAGVFLGAGLIHMLPDSFAAFEEVAPKLDYPLPALLAAGGVLIILWLERVLLASADPLQHVERGLVMPLALTAALSLHSILAGVALGTEGTALGSAAIFLAIIAHKGSAAFSLAVSYKRAGFSGGQTLKLVTLFALMTPLGVGLGLWFGSILSGQAGRGFEAVFDALAAGTFIYIASLDIIVEEFSAPQGRLIKFALLCIGLGVMALIALWL